MPTYNILPLHGADSHIVDPLIPHFIILTSRGLSLLVPFSFSPLP